jgi:hypothetical protein
MIARHNNGVLDPIHGSRRLANVALLMKIFLRCMSLLMAQSGHWLSRRLTQFERPGYRALGFADQLRLAPTHKESASN